MVEQPYTAQAFVKLGHYLKEFCGTQNNLQALKFKQLNDVIAKAEKHNGWFTKDNIVFALDQWSRVLTEDKLRSWLDEYQLTTPRPKSVAIIMAGNIPLVGFHDFLCVLISGNNAICKLSSNDTELLPFIADLLISHEPKLKSRIKFTQGKLDDYDAVIATGSNNTARYFEYYFGKKPNIIRKNRTSVAVLSGKETSVQLGQLGSDIFRYFGLGCRNVSKLFIPKGYDFDVFFKAMFSFKQVIDHHKYANNYDYNKAVYLMSEFKILDNGFMILKEDETMHSPISALFYEHYDSLESLNKLLDAQGDNIQCVVSDSGIEKEVAFGQTQMPALDDYADGVDTLQFLLELS